MTRQPGHLNGSKYKNSRGSNENWRTGSACVGFSIHLYRCVVTQFIRPHHLYVHLHRPGAHALSDALHVVERIRASVHEVVERPLP